MLDPEKKLDRLIEVAELYYEQNLTQSEIAKRMGISRPLVSVLLSDARAAGVVTITITRAESPEQLLSSRLVSRFGNLRRAVVVPDLASADMTDNAAASAAFDAFLADGRSMDVGVGWGSMLGRMADNAEARADKTDTHGHIFPLIGGIGASYRGYHTNEIARILSTKAGLEADYLYMPAFFDSATELEFARHMEAYLAMSMKWDHMDLAVVGISNYPSYPDLGVEYRFGSRLTRENAVGRVLAHYYDISGRVIEADIDNVMQASMEQLRGAREVVAVCSALLRTQSALGAIATNVIDTLILPASLASRLLET